jgi:hypothetical protein
VIDRHGSPADIAAQVQKVIGTDGATYVYDCANRQFEVASAILDPSKPSRLRTLLPMDEEGAKKFKLQRPFGDAAFIHCNNENLAPYAEEFWASVPNWLEEKKVLPTEHQVVNGLEKVKEINEALDAYRDGARAGPQTVVKISS